MTGRIEKTVFISYRRTNGIWARAIYQDLTVHGYDAFYDFQSINSGDFSQIIIENIKGRAHFLVLLTPSALERCADPNDWLRREIETAIDTKRNIVPLILESFDFGSSEAKRTLTGKLTLLKNYNGLKVYSEYFEEGMARLRERYLNIAREAVLHPISSTVEKATKEQQRQAEKNEIVNKKELTAQESFEKAVKSTIPDEQIYYYTEAIKLKPDFVEAYYNRGRTFANKLDLDSAVIDANKAIHIKPEYSPAYYLRALIYSAKGESRKAISDFKKSIELDPTNVGAHASLARILKSAGNYIEAEIQETIARGLMEKENEYNQACIEAIFGNIDRALKLLKIGLERNHSSKEWAQQDPDLENIRDDPRFKELVGE